MRVELAARRRDQLLRQVEQTVARTPVYDIHTHLYDPAFGSLLEWGIDDLLIYHYLVAEAFRQFDLPAEKFWAMNRREQANAIWDALFIKHSPISEACRGVLTTLNLLGIDAKKRDLNLIRKWYADWNVADYTTHCMELARVNRICMTNSPFDDEERVVWERGFRRDERFTAALRIDPLLLDWEKTGAPRLREWGYAVSSTLSKKTIGEIRRFLADWTRRIDARYVMVSLPPEFVYPCNSSCTRLMETAVLPHCRDFGLPFAMMPGVRRGVNAQMRLAGDGVGRSDIASFESLMAAHPDNLFLITALSREDQYSLCVTARKFRNLHLFGCWWFTNTPYLINEISRMRFELLGLSFTPQHSDARVLGQILYKWDHSRKIIGRVLAEKFADLAETGWEPTRAEIERDVQDLFGGAFETFCRRTEKQQAAALIPGRPARGQGKNGRNGKRSGDRDVMVVEYEP